MIVNDSFLLMFIPFNIYLMLKISRVIRRHSAQIHAQQHRQRPTMNMQRYKKSVNVMNYIIGVFVVCYLPSFIVFIVYDVLKTKMLGKNVELYYILHLSITFVLMNSGLNPLIFCWRIEEIRNALVQLLRRRSNHARTV